MALGCTDQKERICFLDAEGVEWIFFPSTLGSTHISKFGVFGAGNHISKEYRPCIIVDNSYIKQYMHIAVLLGI